MHNKNLQKALESERKQVPQQEKLLQDAQRILFKNQLSEKNVLDNLKLYNKSFEFLDDEEIEEDKIYTKPQIKNLCKKLRLKFLPSQIYNGEIPYEAILEIKELNAVFKKDIKHFKIISTATFFSNMNSDNQAMLFTQTIYGNYYLIHTWGKTLNPHRNLKYFALRNFESLFACLVIFSLTEALLMPTRLITTDELAGYFSLYRTACIFHLLIFNAGFTVFGLFSFHVYFSESNWEVPPIKK